MKLLYRFFMLIFLAMLGKTSIAQKNIELTLVYDAKQTQSIGNNKSVVLPYTGYIYYSPDKQKLISFLRPDYLSEFPDGKKVIEEKNNQFSIHEVTTDSLQYVDLYDIGQQKQWSMYNSGFSDQDRHFIQRTLNKMQQKWKMTEETKVINGFFCQKWFVYGGNAKSPFWEVWISKEYTIPYGILMLSYTPGLIVEAENYSSAFKFKLKEIKNGTIENIRGQDIFWPKIFQKATFEKH